MSRMDDIKNRLANKRYIDEMTTTDIEHLLSKLEVAEKALNEVLVFEKQYNDCINRNVTPDHESFISAIGGSASIALQQLRS